MSAGINQALAYINDNLTEPFSETDLARIAGLSTGAFSRSFRRHTGLALVQFINRLRINFACQLMMNDEDLRITEACYASGFNNLSNFNRQFLKHKGDDAVALPRAASRDNFASGAAARRRTGGDSRRPDGSPRADASELPRRDGRIERNSPAHGRRRSRRRKRMLTKTIRLAGALSLAAALLGGTAALAQTAAPWPS